MFNRFNTYLLQDGNFSTQTGLHNRVPWYGHVNHANRHARTVGKQSLAKMLTRTTLVTADRSTDRSQPIARSDRNRSQKPIASTDRSIPTQSAYDLTQPIALYRSHRSHRSQTDRALRQPIAAPKIPIATDRNETTHLKLYILQHLSFRAITNPWESEQLVSKTL